MRNDGTGNQITNSDVLQVLLALKANTMLNTNVAEVCQVTNITNEEIKCNILSTGETITCSKLMNLELMANDVVLVIFTNTDFRQNLRKLRNNKSTNQTETKVLHTKDFGIVIGIVYRK